MGNKQWTFESHNSAIGDTGDYEGTIIITNGDDTFYSHGEDIEDEQLSELCDLLNLMPDLWAEKTNEIDHLKCINSDLKRQIEDLEIVVESLSHSLAQYE